MQINKKLFYFNLLNTVRLNIIANHIQTRVFIFGYFFPVFTFSKHVWASSLFWNYIKSHPAIFWCTFFKICWFIYSLIILNLKSLYKIIKAWILIYLIIFINILVNHHPAEIMIKHILACPAMKNKWKKLPSWIFNVVNHFKSQKVFCVIRKLVSWIIWGTISCSNFLYFITIKLINFNNVNFLIIFFN